jgi:hypothetical protein
MTHRDDSLHQVLLLQAADCIRHLIHSCNDGLCCWQMLCAVYGEVHSTTLNCSSAVAAAAAACSKDKHLAWGCGALRAIVQRLCQRNAATLDVNATPEHTQQQLSLCTCHGQDIHANI